MRSVSVTSGIYTTVWYLQLSFIIAIIIVIIFLFTWGLNDWGLWQERSVHLESVRFNA